MSGRQPKHIHRSTDAHRIHMLICGYLMDDIGTLQSVENELQLVFKRNPSAFKEVSVNGFNHLHDLFHLPVKSISAHSSDKFKIYQRIIRIVEENKEILSFLLTSRNKDGNSLFDFILMQRNSKAILAFLSLLRQAQTDSLFSLDVYANILLSTQPFAGRYVSTFSRLSFCSRDVLEYYGQELDRLLSSGTIKVADYKKSILAIEQYFSIRKQTSLDEFKWFVDRASSALSAEEFESVLLRQTNRNVLHGAAVKPPEFTKYIVECTKAKLGDAAPRVILKMLDMQDNMGVTPIAQAQDLDARAVNNFKLINYLLQLKDELKLEQAIIDKKQAEKPIVVTKRPGAVQVIKPKAVIKQEPKKVKNSSAAITECLLAPPPQPTEGIAVREAYSEVWHVKSKKNAVKKKTTPAVHKKRKQREPEPSSFGLYGLFRYGAGAAIGVATAMVALNLMTKP